MRKRVVAFTSGLSEIGGAARHARLIVEGLARRGWDVKVVTRAGTLRRFRVERSENLTVVEVPGFARRWIGVLLFIVIAVPLGLFWGVKARVVIAFQLFSQASVAAMCSYLLRKPFVAFGTISGLSGEVRWIMNSRARSVRCRALQAADLLIAQSLEMAEEFRHLTTPDRILVINNPVLMVEDPGLNGAPRALFTGRLARYKNLETLLEAWKEIAEGRPDARLTLLGLGGAYESTEERLRAEVAAHAGLSKSVRFPGWAEDVGPYLREADVFVLPSLSEGMSNSLVEAVAWRRVIVASDIPANREVLGEGYPLLFPPTDVMALTDVLSRALFDADSRATALAQIEERVTMFDETEVLARIEHAIARATEGRLSRRLS